MKVEYRIGLILFIGLIVSVILRTYAGIVIAALGIPFYLAYIAREQNILAKSRLFDKDLFLMMGLTVLVILAFEYFSDPRIGLIAMAVVIPLAIYGVDRLKAGNKS
ncbi:hypothetical protein E3E31_07180 [Thermococcus sp. M39]|uniref:hypothetical protein n=1 Tax=unclassified Thermococcus TaxID=2627626 RepID=UPI00143ACF69|nr:MULTISPECIES: hypothetical protein [unclassified Thermococcus]NJE08305.1 hypothetical protein [Thermococcus sp. M39]NJE11798.1 hypothetical protein [Thermococcus sp. LS2]